MASTPSKVRAVARSSEERVLAPHRIHVPDSVLEETRRRIQEVRWDAVPPGDATRYGVSIQDIRRVLDHWAGDYSWRDWEARLNAVPHFTATVDGIEQHFWHIKGEGRDAIPLLLLHGWPGAAVEFWELIGPLTRPAQHGRPDARAFDVVIAELPGFGFSGKPVEPGWGLSRTADALHEVMNGVLGYASYCVHGEDWGSLIAARMASRHASEIAAFHITMPYAEPYGDIPRDPDWDAHMYDVTGYDHVQAQIPDALTVGMVDSPLALTAWVIEKFTAWSDLRGSVVDTYGLDHLVTVLHFYWLTSSIVSSTRLYREVALEGPPTSGPPQIPVPAGVAVFPKEPFGAPREWLEAIYDIRRYTVFEFGGHFAALERPDDVLNEIREFFPAFYGQPGEGSPDAL
jgi:pimeloyl-ACP methyl ester carboxylesterase